MSASTVATTADGPRSWVDTVLQRRHDRWSDVGLEAGSGSGGWLRISDLVDDDAHLLAELHRRVMEDSHVPADTAATYLAGWFAGTVADAVGHCLATAGAGLIVVAGELRFHQHREGWVDRLVVPGARAVVPLGHPWAGRPDVRVVDDVDTMLGETVPALVAAVSPVVDACHGLAPIGRVGLWNEVGDSLGLALDDGDGADESVCVLLTSAVTVPGTPWRAKPKLRIVVDGELGPVAVRHKGGCCLAYKGDHPADDDGPTDPDLAAYVAVFGDDGPHYCNTCRFRDEPDSEARQLFWRRLEHARQNEEEAR
jgi:hypothetical protein